MHLIDVAIRWESGIWVAYNIGPKPPHASKFWSTALGAIELEEAFDLFRNSGIVVLPAKDLR